MSVTDIELRNGRSIPQLGFGTYKVTTEDVIEPVLTALAAGYRHLDTAEMYGNEAGVGEALRRSGIPRDDVYVTSKLDNPFHEPVAARRAFERTMDALGLEQLDLFLIHWPLAASTDYVATWRTLIELRSTGRIRSIGTSNFQGPHLRRIIEETGVTPAVNQVEIHPYLQQGMLRELHRELGIVTEAWSPLARGQVLHEPALQEIAEEHHASVAQVVIAWHLSRGDVVIPKSVTPERITANLAAADLELTERDLERIAGLDEGRRVGSHPDRVELG